MIKNLVTSLILYEKIITSDTKGKVLKSEAEKILSLAKRADLHARRLVLSRLNSKLAAKKIFEDLNQQFKDKKSGFVRIIKINNRKGDNASQVLVELLIKHKEKSREISKQKSKELKPKDKNLKKSDKPSFWKRLRESGQKTAEIKPTKKTIERTTSK